jgi:hypothetical protein
MKLVLRKETLKVLTDQEAGLVAGGRETLTGTCVCAPTVSVECPTSLEICGNADLAK